MSAAAADLKIEPRQLQSITWEAKKRLFPDPLSGGTPLSAAQKTDIETAWRDYHNDPKMTLAAVQSRVVGIATAKKKAGEQQVE